MYISKKEELKKLVIDYTEYNKKLTEITKENPNLKGKVPSKLATENSICMLIDGIYLECCKEQNNRIHAFSFDRGGSNIGKAYFTMGLVLLKLYGIEEINAYSLSGRYDTVFINQGFAYSKDDLDTIFGYDHYIINIADTLRNILGDDISEALNE